MPVSCAVAGDPTAFNGIACSSTLDTDPYVIVTGLQPNSFNYKVEITSIINAPSSGQVRDILCEFCTDNSCTSVAETGDYTQVTFTPDVLTAADVAIDTDKGLNGEEYATLYFGILLSNPLVASGTITISMPKQNYWFYFQGAPNRECLVMDCYAGDLLVQVSYSESDVAVDEISIPLNTGAGCIAQMAGLSPGACYMVEEINQMYDIVQINLANTQPIDANLHVRVRIYPCKNPSSRVPLNTFSGYTGDSRYNPIESFEGISLSTVLPNTFESQSGVSIVGSTTGVTDYYLIAATGLIYEFDLYTAFNDIPWDSMITIKWPDNWDLDCSLTYTITEIVGFSYNYHDCNVDENRLELHGFQEGSTYDYLQYQVGRCNFQVSGITNPDTDTVKYFTVSTWHKYTVDQQFYEIDSAYTIFNVEFTTGTIDIHDVYPTASMIYSTDGKYYFSFTPEHDITTDMFLYIEIPRELQVQQNSACIITEVTGSTALATTWYCYADANNNKITLQNYLASDSAAGTTQEFYIDSIRNPGSYSTPGTLYMAYTTVDGGQVDSGSYNAWEDGSILFNSSFIQAFTVSADNLEAGAEPVTYTFTLLPYSRVVQGAYIVLKLPEELGVPDTNNLARGCQSGDISGFSYSVLTCDYSAADHHITMKNGWRFAYSDGDPPSIYFTLQYLLNPRTTAPTQMFNVTIYSEEEQPLFYFNSSDGPSVQMTSVPQPEDIRYERSNEENGVYSNYSWYILTKNEYQNGDFIEFHLPTGIRFTDESKVIGTSFWIDGEQISNLSGDRQGIEIELVLTNPIQGGSIITMMFTEITSPTSFRALADSIHYEVTSSDGYDVEAIESNLFVQNSQMGKINPAFAGITPDYWENNILANYTLAFEFLNFEQNLQIWITVPPEITIPAEEVYGPLRCRGLKGTDNAILDCQVFYDNSTILISDAVTSKEVAPAKIEMVFESFMNPGTNIITQSFRIETRTWDGYPMDLIDEGLEVNFYCIFPCRTCQEATPSVCESCYTSTTTFIYLLNDTCLEECPEKMYVIDELTIQPSCDFCEFPCQNCQMNATDCQDCYPGWLYYDEGNMCYEEIIWYFPFLGATVLVFIFVLIVDCYKRSTNFLHSALYFLCWVEDAVIGYLLYMWLIGQIEGDRSLTIISLGVELLLNFCFMAIHCQFMVGKGSIEYRQLYQNYKYSSHCISVISYLINFKMTIMLISHFAGKPRFSGTLTRDHWQKFNIFAMLYIALVYLPFTADFYLYFTTFGLRKLTSFIAAEACIIRTIICLILMLEVLSQCACSGIGETDLAQRAQLNKSKKKGKKRRRAHRSGMGNEPEYDEEYDSEEDSFDEAQMVLAIEAEEGQNYEYEEEEEEEEAEEEATTKGKIKKNDQLNQLELLAKQMKAEREALEAEQRQILEKKMKLLEEKEKYLNQFDIVKTLEEHKETVNKEIVRTKDDVDARLMEKLMERDRDRHIRGNNKPTIVLPQPVQEEVNISKSINGDEEYWLQHDSALIEKVSVDDRVRERDASLIEFIQPEEAQVSFDDQIRERDASVIEFMEPEDAKQSMVDGKSYRGELDEEQRAQQSQGPVKQTNLSYRASDNVQDVENVSAIFGDINQTSMHKSQANRTDDFRQSADFGSKTMPIDRSINQINDQDKSFLDQSQDMLIDRSHEVQNGKFKPLTPNEDETGRSDESDEGIVADHRPFNGIKQDMENSTEQLRKSLQYSGRKSIRDKSPEQHYMDTQGSIPNIDPIFSGRSRFSNEMDNTRGRANQGVPVIDRNVNRSMESMEDAEVEDHPSGRRRVKQVIYSDKSESSVDDQMDDTPSNYNLANGRIDGKSMGLKAILLFAKNQGIQLGQRGSTQMNELESINEDNDYNPNRGQARTQLQQYPQNAISSTSGINRQQRHSLVVDSGGENDWKPMTKPLQNHRSNFVIQGHEEQKRQMQAVSQTLDYNENLGKSKTKRNPGSMKQFTEPSEVDLTSRFKQKQDLGKIQKNNFTANKND